MFFQPQIINKFSVVLLAALCVCVWREWAKNNEPHTEQPKRKKYFYLSAHKQLLLHIKRINMYFKRQKGVDSMMQTYQQQTLPEMAPTL